MYITLFPFFFFSLIGGKGGVDLRWMLGWDAGCDKKRTGTVGGDLIFFSLRKGSIGSEVCVLCLGGRERDLRMQTNMHLSNNKRILSLQTVLVHRQSFSGK